MANCNVQSLISDACASGFTCLDSRSREAVLLQLLCNLAAAASGSSGGLAGSGSPEGVVTAPVGTTYYDTTSGSFYVKRTGTGNTGWQVLIT